MDMTFGEKLKAARKQQGLVQKQLAESAGVGQAAIANYEKGVRFPGEDTLRKLTEILDISLDYLLSVPLRNYLPASTEESDGQTFLSDTELIKMLLDSNTETALEHIEAWLTRGGRNVHDAYTQILVPLLIKTGELWAAGKLTVAQEHIISGRVRELIVLLGNRPARSRMQGLQNRGSWLGFCAPGDEHDMAVLMISRMMKLRNWNALFLGIGPPLNSLLNAVERYQPDAIAISITISKNWNSLEAYIGPLMEAAGPDCRMVIGGQAISGHEKYLQESGFKIARSIENAITLAED